MPTIYKYGKNNIKLFTSEEAARWCNRALSRNGRVVTNDVTLKDKRLSQYINNETMSVLDNYAKHENMDIYLKSLEGDFFDDLAVGLAFKNKIGNRKFLAFPIKIQEGKDSLPIFLKELYTKVHKYTHPEYNGPKIVHTKKPTALERLRLNYQILSDKFEQYKLERIRSYIKKNQYSSSELKRFISDVLEHNYYEKLYGKA